MITEVSEDRLLVISDLHLGNPVFRAKRDVTEFLDYAVETGASVCINGDGLDIAQTSFPRIARDTPEVFSRFKKVTDNGGQVYYVIGNHDLPLEYFFQNWGFIQVVPFLNVISGDQRIHVEHGHLYDPLYLAAHGVYMIATMIAGVLLKLFPPIYKLWTVYEKSEAMPKSRRSQQEGIKGEHQNYIEAAEEILSRGFDTIIFGHTHRPGVVELPEGQHYFNTGSWLQAPKFAEIDNGQVALKSWYEGAVH